MSLSRSLLVVATLVVAFPWATQVEAGVKGKTYVGFVKTIGGNLGDVIGLNYTFTTSGTAIAVENQAGGTFTFNGTYQELDLGIVSFWNGVLFDGSPDGQAQINGISFLGGIISTIGAVNADIGLTSSGFLFQTGSAKSSDTPSTTEEPAGVSG